MSKISIIIPIYNAEKYIDECIRCILQQTLDDYEVILVNDGSTDKSQEICEQYAATDTRISIINKKNGGAGSARNAGLDVAKGEYLYFPDADDYFKAQMLENLYNLAKKHDADIVYSGINHIYKDEKGNEYIHHKSICKIVDFKTREECRYGVMELFPTTTIFDVPWNKIYKKSVITENNIRFTDLRRCQDAVFNIDFYNFIERVISVPEIYYNYRENNQAEVWRKFPKNYIDIVVFYNKHLKDILSNWGIYKDNIKIHYDTTFIMGVYGCFEFCFNPNWKMNKAEKLKYINNIVNNEYVCQRVSDVTVKSEANKCLFNITNKNIKNIYSNIKKEKIKKHLRNNKLIYKLYTIINRKK